MTISIITPVYNVRDYLEKCVESVLAQTMNDWELILVNDGSTDGSEKLCRALAAGDSRIRVLDQTNAGVGAARNAGLDAAAGEYITFLDSDDAYAPEHLERLYAAARESGAVVTACGAVSVDETGAEGTRFQPKPGRYEDDAVLPAFFLDSDGLYGCWNKLFPAEAAKKHRFPPYARAEDALYCARVLAECPDMTVTEDATYRYFRRSGSATTGAVNARSVDQVLAWQEIYGLLEEKAPALCPFAAKKLVHDCDSLYKAYAASALENQREALEILKKTRLEYSRRTGGERRARAALTRLLYRLSPETYYRLAGGR